jgi:hypothetical protein
MALTFCLTRMILPASVLDSHHNKLLMDFFLSERSLGGGNSTPLDGLAGTKDNQPHLPINPNASCRKWKRKASNAQSDLDATIKSTKESQLDSSLPTEAKAA